MGVGQEAANLPAGDAAASVRLVSATEHAVSELVWSKGPKCRFLFSKMCCLSRVSVGFLFQAGLRLS